MKVIKHNTRHIPIFRGVCGFCRAELEAERREFDSILLGYGSPDRGKAACPLCGESVYLTAIKPDENL